MQAMKAVAAVLVMVVMMQRRCQKDWTALIQLQGFKELLVDAAAEFVLTTGREKLLGPLQVLKVVVLAIGAVEQDQPNDIGNWNCSVFGKEVSWDASTHTGVCLLVSIVVYNIEDIVHVVCA